MENSIETPSVVSLPDAILRGEKYWISEINVVCLKTGTTTRLEAI
jgi:hypothetical protein